jgi:hypothetical protein
MGRRAKKVVLRLEDVKERLADKVDRAVLRVSLVVERGGKVVHHEIPSNSKLLPYPIVHCPLSTQPLYPPPSIERPEQLKLKEMGREVAKCLFAKVQKVNNRSISEMEEFSKRRKGE